MKTAIITASIIGAWLLMPIIAMIIKAINWEMVIIHIELALYYGTWIMALIPVSLMAVGAFALMVWNRAIRW